MGETFSPARAIIKHSLSRSQDPPKAHAPRTGRVRIAGQKKRADKTPGAKRALAGYGSWPIYKKTSQPGSLTQCMMAEEEGFEPSYGEYP